MSSSDWKYQSNPVGEIPNGYYGFVYRITDRVTGMMYIGKKFFYSKKTLPPLKGKKRKRRKLVESNWKEYWSSSPQLIASVEKYGPDRFRRDILVLCENKFECAYEEAKIQFTNNVLFDNDYYNEVINVRLRKPKKR